MSDHPILVQALRGDTVESHHRGAIAVVDDHGRLIWSCGDINRPIFPRSAVKLLQALPLVASGAAQSLGLSDAELALACASHGGEPAHAQTAASMLAKAGVDLNVLECGAHWPHHEGSQRRMARDNAKPTALNNNCSGKHSGFVCVGCATSGLRGPHLAAFMKGYVEPEHPVMQAVTQAISHATDHDLRQAPRGTDGCSIPTYAIPLQNLALGFARAATGHGLSAPMAQAATRLRRAIAAEPFMVAGTGRFDTKVMQRLGERICCKVGAEGVYCASIPERGWGVALKMDDGNTSRAAEVAMAALMPFLLDLSEDDTAWVETLSNVSLRNWQGRLVGHLRANPEFQGALTRRASLP